MDCIDFVRNDHDLMTWQEATIVFFICMSSYLSPVIMFHVFKFFYFADFFT